MQTAVAALRFPRTQILLLSLGPAAVHGQLPPDWTAPFEPVQIADDLFYVGSAGLSTFLLTSAEGHVLIDAPLVENVPLVLENVRSLGFDPRDIRLHVLTHAHFDHVAGLASLMAETGGELLVSEADAVFVTEGRDFGFASDGYPPAAVARTVKHLEPVRLGDLELVPHLTPGHTPGCTSWSGTVTIDGEPHSFVLVCSLSVLGDYRLGAEDPTYPGQATDFCRSVHHLEMLEPDIFLSNHAQFFGLAEKARSRRAGDVRAFVRRGEYERFLATAAVAIDRALERQGLEGCSLATDPRDGRTYPTTIVGDQTWLGANLDYDAGSGSRCLADLPANCDRYGRLYTWPAARTACPGGWRLPTEADWQALERFLGVPEDELDALRYRGSDEGRRLRLGGDTGMNVLLAGYMRPNGTPRRESERAAFWTATEDEEGARSWHRDVSADPRVYRSAVGHGYYLSVRCVSDR